MARLISHDDGPIFTPGNLEMSYNSTLLENEMYKYAILVELLHPVVLGTVRKLGPIDPKMERKRLKSDTRRRPDATKSNSPP